MGKRRKVRWSWRVSALLLGMFALGGSVAVAAAPQGNVINACRNLTTGALRVIYPGNGDKCGNGEGFLRWSHWAYKSTWLPQSQYAAADVVTYVGSSYIARVPPPVGTKPTNTNYWGVVARAGAPGLLGPIGGIGKTGLKGATGLIGAVGATGATGVKGLTGAIGATGPQGLLGPTGPQGLLGPTGSQGLPGLPGATGSQGLPGLPGLDGATGPTGLQGLTGVAGPTGLQGIPGVTGPTGVGADPIFAKINSDGTTAYGDHVTSSSYASATKTYTVTFDRNISACAVIPVSGSLVAIPVVGAHPGTSVTIQFTTLLLPALTPNAFEVTVVC